MLLCKCRRATCIRERTSTPCHVSSLPVQGQAIQVTFTQTATHYGHFELRVCPLSDPLLLAEHNELSEDCFSAH